MIKAKNIMTENVATIKESATIVEAAKSMVKKHVSTLLVTKDNMPVAIVTENDLVKGSINKNLSRVKDVMSKNFHNVSPDRNYYYLVKKLREENIKRFPVVHNDSLIGIITETDIIDTTRDFTRFHQIMQEVILAVFGLVTAFFLFFFSPLGQSIKNSIF